MKENVLTGKEWHFLKLGVPFVSGSDRLVFLVFSLTAESFSGCMLHDVLQIEWINSVQDIEEVFSRWHFVFWVLIAEVDFELFIVFEIGP